MTRLGVIRMVVNPLAPRIWKLVPELVSSFGGETALDYLLLCPATQRACSPSAKPLGDSYPSFIPTVLPSVKTIHSNLTAVTSKPGKSGHPDRGLGGQLLEVPPGETQMLIKLSSMVPDDPTASAVSEQLSHEAKVTVWATPRWYLARTV
jgi:hypothetical protein